MNHRLCSHPATSSARARCRRSRTQSAESVSKWERDSHARAVVNEIEDAGLAKVVARTAALGIDVTHTDAVKPDDVTDVDWHLLLRNRARFTGSPWPTDEERTASLSKVWCTTCHLLHDLPSCDDLERAKRETVGAHVTDVVKRSVDARPDLSSSANDMLPTFANARALAADIPEGRYAVRQGNGTVKFYKLDKPTTGRWAGYVFLKVQASSEFYPVKLAAVQMAVYAAILEAGIKESSALYGHELGSCGVCGRTLTDADSIAEGIGPRCAAKMGW